jgi:hypothetical protein
MWLFLDIAKIAACFGIAVFGCGVGFFFFTLALDISNDWELELTKKGG